MRILEVARLVAVYVVLISMSAYPIYVLLRGYYLGSQYQPTPLKRYPGQGKFASCTIGYPLGAFDVL